ncbi:MAG: nucleoside hydrolase [Promethearchaeota archaeon]|jgi:inosine-uridine nucleoside N-ribohydrolase
MNSKESQKTGIIFDTDMDFDCDDTGALAVLHALMDLGETEILGIIVDVPVEASARCVMTINNYYNRLDIPVGLLEDDGFESGKKYQLYRDTRQLLNKFVNPYTETVVKQFSKDSIKNQKIWDAVTLYRQLLSNAANNSVVIIAVGLLTALRYLLESKPDEISQLSGSKLVKKKVKKLVTMGIGKYPEAKAEFNWLMDWESARIVIHQWPTPLVVQSNGTEFRTGNTLSSKTPESNPVRNCYETFLGGQRKGGVFSWDLITALYGVRGSEPFFDEKYGYRLILEPELGINHWIPDGKSEYNHSFLQLKSPNISLKRVIEKLLVKHPKKRSQVLF